MALVAYDTCDYCGGSGAKRMLGSDRFICEVCRDELIGDDDDDERHPHDMEDDW